MNQLRKMMRHPTTNSIELKSIVAWSMLISIYDGCLYVVW